MRSTDPSGRRFATQLVVLGCVVFLAVAAGAGVRATYGAQTSADEPQYLLSALSIAEDGDLDIADELRAERWRAFHEAQLPVQTKPLPDGREVSPHDPLLPLLLAGPMAAGGWLGAKLTMAALAGLLAAAVAWLAVRRFAVPAPLALAVVSLFALSPPLAVYGTQIYPEIPAALAVTLGIAALTGPLDRRGCWLLACAVVALPWLAIKYVPVAAVLAGAALVRLAQRGRRGAGLGLVLTFLSAGMVFAAVHLVVWTGLTAYSSGDHFVGGDLTAIGYAPNYLGRSVRLLGLLVDRHFGLAAWQPAWLLLVPAGAMALRRRPPHTALLAGLVAAGWLNATFVALTMHGYWFPGRQVVVILPAAVLLVLVAARDAAWLRRGLLAAGLLGVWSYGWLLVAGRRATIAWIVDFFRVGDPWYEVWSRLLPAYTVPSAATWWRHAAWVVVAAAAAVLAWRAASYGVGSSSTEPDALPEADPDALPDPEPSSSRVRTEAPSSSPQAVADSSRARTAPDRRRDRAREDTDSSLDPTRARR